MKPFDTITYKGKTIVIVDISGTKPEEAIVTLREAQKKISELPPKSVLILTDVTDAVFNATSSNAIKEFSAKNTPYIKASATVGSTEMRAILLRSVASFTGRQIGACGTRQEAMDWLVSHS